MEIFQFDRGEKVIGRYDSIGLRATRVAAADDRVTVTCLRVEPAGVIGTHPASGTQLFLVIAGDGWVAGADGERHRIAAGWGARWEAGETHTSGTDGGLTALAIEGPALDLYRPETPDP